MELKPTSEFSATPGYFHPNRHLSVVSGHVLQASFACSLVSSLVSATSPSTIELELCYIQPVSERVSFTLCNV